MSCVCSFTIQLHEECDENLFDGQTPEPVLDKYPTIDHGSALRQLLAVLTVISLAYYIPEHIIGNDNVPHAVEVRLVLLPFSRIFLVKTNAHFIFLPSPPVEGSHGDVQHVQPTTNAPQDGREPVNPSAPAHPLFEQV